VADNKPTIYGASWCPDCSRVKQWFGEHHLDYVWVDVDRDQKAADYVMSINGGNRVIPTIKLGNGQVFTNPSNNDLARELGVAENKDTSYHDLVIVGAGPTGLSAAIYTTREDISTLLVEKAAVGGLASITDKIDNYPGFPDGIGGLELATQMEAQAKRFGATFDVGVGVTSIADEGQYKRVETTEGTRMAKAVLIATGSSYRQLGVPGEKELIGRGVHYCATCDGPFYRDKRIVVVGGGNSAMQESLFLTKFSKDIVLLVRGTQLKVLSTPGIQVQFDVQTTEIVGHEGKVQAVEGIHKDTGKTVRFETDGVFVFIGLDPNTAWVKGSVELDQYGFVVTDRTFATSMPGVYAAGDVRSGATWQIASAVGEGVTAALMIREHLKDVG
jgi:thioredoxin reductase (NADPH)